jgi:hypothetical protein
MKSCAIRRVLRLLVVIFTGATGFALSASIGLAQESQGGKHETGAAPSNPPHTVSGVTVRAPPKPHTIPPHKRVAFDAEAANRKAWTTYRATPPARTGGGGLPGASPQPENYPGLSKLGSH